MSYLSSFYITHSSSQAPSSFLAHQSPGSRFHEAQGPWGSMAYPLLITATKQEQNKMGTSMRESWERTRSHLYSIISTRRSLSQAWHYELRVTSWKIKFKSQISPHLNWGHQGTMASNDVGRLTPPWLFPKPSHWEILLSYPQGGMAEGIIYCSMITSNTRGKGATKLSK